MGGVTITVQDNQLGTLPPGLGQTEFVIGVSSGGTVPNFTPYEATNPSTFQTNSGNGPGPRLAAFGAGTGNATGLVTIPIVTPGAFLPPSGVMAPGGSNTGSMTCTASGNPNDEGYLVVTCRQQASTPVAFGTAGIVIGISLDGGQTDAYTVNMNTATTVTTGSAFTKYTGVTLTLSGTPAVGDFLYDVMVAPLGNAAGVQSAINAIAANNSLQFEHIFVAGVWSAADATNFDGYMQTLANSKKDPARLFCGARDIVWGGASSETEVAWMTSIEADFQNNSTTRVGVIGGYYRFTDPFTQSLTRSSAIYGAIQRDSSVQPWIDWAEVDLGSIPNLTLPGQPDKFANGTFVYHDDNNNPGLQAARFTCMAQWKKFPGMFFLPAQLMAPPGSDYGLVVHGSVIDVVWEVIYQYFTQVLSRPVRVSVKTGFILPQDRLKLQMGANSAIANAIGAGISGYAVAVGATDPILSTSALSVGVYIAPLAYLNSINATLALVNPANIQTFPVTFIQA